MIKKLTFSQHCAFVEARKYIANQESLAVDRLPIADYDDAYANGPPTSLERGLSTLGLRRPKLFANQ